LVRIGSVAVEVGGTGGVKCTGAAKAFGFAHRHVVPRQERGKLADARKRDVGGDGYLLGRYGLYVASCRAAARKDADEHGRVVGKGPPEINDLGHG